jgi:hypothetical protein
MQNQTLVTFALACINMIALIDINVDYVCGHV